MYGYYWSYFSYLFPGLILAFIAQIKISSAYEKNSRINSGTSYRGADVARIIMDRHGLYNVEIRSIPGKMTDHYNPSNKTLNLSDDVYNGNSIAALSIAAHEVGHALQDQTDYSPLRFRTMLVPAANLGSNMSMVFILIGIIFSSFFVKIGIALFSMVVLFQIVTLPVEFNASSRALRELSDGIMPQDRIKGAKQVLSAAALTYVASTLMAIGQLLRLLAIFGGGRDDRD